MSLETITCKTAPLISELSKGKVESNTCAVQHSQLVIGSLRFFAPGFSYAEGMFRLVLGRNAEVVHDRKRSCPRSLFQSSMVERPSKVSHVVEMQGTGIKPSRLDSEMRLFVPPTSWSVADWKSKGEEMSINGQVVAEGGRESSQAPEPYQTHITPLSTHHWPGMAGR